jgi:cysteine desulfuration protein SufE
MNLPEEINRLIETFDFLDEWNERYRHLLDLAKQLPPMPDELKVESNLVQGCLSQVWLVVEADPHNPEVLQILADSDAHIVRGLVAIVLMLYSGKTSSEIASLDAKEVFAKLGLDQHLSVGRRNGLESMVRRIESAAATRAG